jgi:hypothetical protein
MRFRRLTLATLTGMALFAAALTPFGWRNVAVSTPHGAHIAIGTIRTSLSPIAAALAQAVETVTLENVVVDLGPVSYRAPKIEFRSVNLPRGDLGSLFDANVSEPLGRRLARLSARQILIPELISERNIGGRRETVHYRNTVAENITEGRSARATSDGGVIEATRPGKPDVRGTFGRIALIGVDAAETARALSDKATPDNRELKRLYESFAVETLAFADDKGVEVTVSRLEGRDVRARPTAESWMEFTRFMASLPEDSERSQAEETRLLAQLSEAYGALEIGSLEAVGLTFRDTRERDQPEGRIARMTYSGAAPGRPSEARAEGMEFSAKNGRTRVESIVFSGFSLENTVAGLRTVGDRPLRDLEPADARKLIPTIGTVRVAGLDVDVLDENGTLKALPEKIRFAIRQLEFGAEKPLNGIPTEVRFGVDGFTMAIPAAAKEDGLKTLLDLGYRTVDVSFATHLAWNEAAAEIAVRELSFRGAEMGALALQGTLGGVSKDVFDPDTALASVALVGATAKSLELTIENRGLIDRYLAQEAKSQKKTPEALRREYGTAAAVAIPVMLGSSEQAKSLGQAIARFVAKPGRLAIRARAKNPGGVGIADVAAASAPAEILDQVNVISTTDERL